MATTPTSDTENGVATSDGSSAATDGDNGVAGAAVAAEESEPAAEDAAPKPQNSSRKGMDLTGKPLSPVNSPQRRASNRAERRREAEEDRALVDKAQAGDMQAFRQLVERHQRRAFAIAIGLVRDENDAREIVQEAFLRVYRSINRFQGSSSFFTWLYRIVTNLSIDLIRKPARRETELFENPAVADNADAFPFVSRIDGADPMDVMRRREISARIQQALDALPPYHRSVILMREVQGMSYQQMADAMNVSKGTIMSRLFHARQKLQKALADCYREHTGKDPSKR